MKLIAKHKTNILVWAVLIGLIFNLILWAYTFLQYGLSTDLVPLHYNIYFGIDLIGYKSNLFFYPLLGLVIIIVNSILSWLLRIEKLIGYFLIMSAVLAQVFILITEVALIMNYY